MNQGQFTLWQKGLLEQFPLVHDAQDNPERKEEYDAAINVWVRLFARLLRDLYNGQYELSADTVEHILAEYQQKIAQDLIVLKWAESCRAHKDVRLEEAAHTVKGMLQEVRGYASQILGLRMTMFVPHVPTEEAPEEKPPVERGVFIPANGRLPPKQAA